MYGTIARNRAKPGRGDDLRRLAEEFSADPPAGARASFVYKSDADPDEYWVVAIFDSREAYTANAGRPDQDAFYHRMRELLAEDPEWHDGEIIHTFQR